jgi:hypothetical protein
VCCLMLMNDASNTLREREREKVCVCCLMLMNDASNTLRERERVCVCVLLDAHE